MNRTDSESGFTVTELLVALTVTIIGLAGLLSLHVTTVRGNASAGQYIEATAIAEETLEALRHQPILEIENDYQAVGPSEWSPGESLPAVSGRASQTYLRRLYAIELPGNPNLVRFRVQVMWSTGGVIPSGPSDAEHVLELETIRTRTEVL